MNKTILALAGMLAFSGCAILKKTPAPAVPEAAVQPVRAAPAAAQTRTPAADDTVKTSKPLFYIERSINKNVVHYDAQLTADGRLAPKEPAVVYWKMLAEDGRTAELTWLEKFRAYGFTIEPTAAGNDYKMALAAAPGRPFLIKRSGDEVYAEGLIGGRPAILERVFVNLTEGVLGPTVKTIELYGKNLQTGQPAKEVITPN